MRVLYVEDNPQDADLARRELARQAPSIEMEIAPTLEAARSRFNGEETFDLILIDLHLPDGSGLDLLGDLTDRQEGPAAVILTGVGDQEIALAALKAGATDYVAKRTGYLNRLPPIMEAAVHRRRSETARLAHSLRVLYVERSMADVDLTRRHFARHALHIQLDIALSGEEVLQRLSADQAAGNPYDALLLDYRLPGSSGLDLLKTLRQERGLDLPIVIVTGYGDDELATLALRFGATDYVVKHPGYLFELPAVLENAVNYVQLVRERAALRRSETRFRLLAENAQDMIYRYRLWPEPGFDYVSPAVTEITGYTPEEHYADPELARALVAPPDNGSRMAWTPADAGWPVVKAWTRRDGVVLWTEQRTVPLFDDEGRLVAIEGIARDITARRLSDEQLRLQGAALNAAGNAIIITDRDSRIQWCNPAFTTLTGYTLAEARGKNPNELIRSGLHDAEVYQEMAESLRNGDIWQGRLINRRKDGRLYSEEQTITPVRDEQGEVTHFIAIKQDISERIRIEEELNRHQNHLEKMVVDRTEELKREKERVEAILDSSPDGILLLDLNGQIQQANPAFGRLFGARLTDTIGRSIGDLVTPGDAGRLHELLRAAAEGTAGRRVEVCARRLDGTTFEAEVGLTRTGPEAAVGGLVCTLRDITGYKLAQKTLEQALQREKELGELKSRFVTMASHDFRTPLSTILAATETLVAYRQRLTDEQIDRRLANIRQQVKHLNEIVEDVLILGRIDEGQLPFRLEPADLDQLCRAVIREFDNRPDHRHRLRYTAAVAPLVLPLDASLIQRLISNLIQNAVKYSPAGEPVEVRLDRENDEAVLTVYDRGIGIPAEDMSYLFRPFHRAANVGTIEGSGLGLTIGKEAVDRHGGTIQIESAERSGTTVIVRLPLAPTAREERRDDEDPGH